MASLALPKFTVVLAFLAVFVLTEAALTARQKSLLLSKHNEMRMAVSPPAANMRTMSWDDDLARVAQKYAEKCIWTHNSLRTQDFNRLKGSSSPGYPIGENLYLSTHWDKDYVVQKGMEGFDDEKRFYTFRTNHCSQEPCGHYTQIVWATTETVGCGIHKCPSVRGSPYRGPNMVLVCNYGPTGNWQGKKPYLPGTPCSQCPEGRKRCIAGMCYPGEPLPRPQARSTPAPTIRSKEQSPRDQSEGAVEVLVQRTETDQEILSMMTRMDHRLKALEASRTSARASAHLNGVKQGSTNPAISTGQRLDALFWSPTAAGSHVEGGFKVHDGQLVVPSAGLYFVYSQVWTSRHGPVRHFIYAGPRRLMVAGVSDGNMQTAWLGGVHRLNKGDLLKVVLTNRSPDVEQSVWVAKGHSYFGAFKL